VSRNRPRRDWTADQWKRHNAGLRRLDEAFGRSATRMSSDRSRQMKLHLLDMLGFGPTKTKGGKT